MEDDKMVKKYCLGFYFNLDLSLVTLIRKKRPEWQKGRFNGIGGKIEKGEESMNAMIREFREETSLEFDRWVVLGNIVGQDNNEDWQIDLYCGYGSVHDVETTTDEEVIILSVNSIDSIECLHNVPWLIHISLARLKTGSPQYIQVSEGIFNSSPELIE